MKKLLLSTVLALSAFAASAQSMGPTTMGIEYNYLNAPGGGSYLAGHTAGVSLKQNFKEYGNVKGFLGWTQQVTSIRENYTLVGAEYSYDFPTEAGVLSPSAGYAYAFGSGTAGSFGAWNVGATLRTPVSQGTRIVTSGFYGDSIVTSSTNYNLNLGLGVEVDLPDGYTLKGGYAYTRLFDIERNANNIFVGLERKF